MTSRPRPSPDSCSVLHELARVPAVGTAARADAWVALEQNGPWGAKAPTQSHLDPVLGAALEDRAETVDARLALIRRPGAHPDDVDGGRRVFLAGGLNTVPWLLTGEVSDPAMLLDFDWRHLHDPSPAGVQDALPDLSVAPHPVLLVCTNGKRDVCCAVRGRPVATAAGAQRPDEVWETSHTGGHRFAPTGVMLPWGTTVARLDEESAVLAVDAAHRGEFTPGLLDDFHHRGRSSLSPREQAAEHYVRQLLGDLALTGFSTVVRDDGDIEVTRTGGHTWVLHVTEHGGYPDLPASCGKAAVPVHDWEISVRR